MKKYSISLAAVLLAFSITVSPTNVDYGNVAVRAITYRTITVGGVPHGDSATATLTGLNAGDWFINGGGNKCLDESKKGYPCAFEIGFMPKSKGPKSAKLVVAYRGSTASSTLKGIGVDAVCEQKVVLCNYAHLYKGVFSWNEGLRGPNSSTVTVMQADIDGLTVACNGTMTITDEGGTHVFTSNGKGLVAVEFKIDDQERKVYNITVACPSPGNAGKPSQPAELGHFDMQTYDQLHPQRGVPVVEGMDLAGNSSYENPAADALNGVTGQVIVRWNLKRK
jgi:hypothetical protein